MSVKEPETRSGAARLLTAVASVKSVFGWLFPPADRRAARHVLWMGAIIVMQFLGGLAQVALSARILGPENFGVLALIMAMTLLAYRFMSMPGFEAVTTYVARSVAEGRSEDAAATLRFTFGGAFGLALLAYGLLAAVTLTTGGLFGIESAHVSAMLLYGITGVFMAASIESLAVLRVANRLALALAVTTAGTLTMIAALLAVWISDGGLAMVVLALAAEAGVHGVGMLLAAAASAGSAGVPNLLGSLSVRAPRDVIGFQAASFFQAKAVALMENIDVILLGALTSASQVGMYRGALSIMTATRLPIRPIAEGVQAEYSRRWYASDAVGIRRLSRSFTTLSVVLAVAIYGVLAVFHGPVVHLVLGPEFADAANLLLILIPGAAIWMSISALRVLPAAMGRAGPSLTWTCAALIAQVCVLLLLAPTHLSGGAAWARTVFFLSLGAIAIPFTVTILRRSCGGLAGRKDETRDERGARR